MGNEGIIPVMFRTVHALLLILALLACPYRCGGAIACDNVQSHGCPCCKYRRAAREEGQAANASGKQRAPSAPEKDCGCDCLCQGAVLTDDEAFSAAPAAFELLAVAELPLPFFPAGDGKSAAVPDDSPPNCSSSAGRFLRLVIQSLQI